MKIKRIIQICMVISLLLFTHCNDFLNVSPESTISPQTFWSRKADADNWMTGIYRQMQITMNRNNFDWGEARSDNVDLTGTGVAQTIMAYNQLYSRSDGNSDARFDWEDLYRTISLCNFGLKYFPQMIEADVDGGSDTYREYIGQCYAMRGLMFFYGLRIWGRIPIVTDAVESMTEQLEYPRSSIKEVRAQILGDLRRSLATINTNNTEKYRLNRTSVYAILTDVYAYFQEYDHVIGASDTFLTATSCSWIAKPADWKTIFLNPPQSVETVFTMYWDYLESGTLEVARYLGTATYSSMYKMRTELFTELWQRQDTITLTNPARRWIDVRFANCFDSSYYRTVTTYRGHGLNVKFGKYVPWDPDAVNEFNKSLKGTFVYPANAEAAYFIPIYRYADVMSLRAEALALKGSYDQSLDILKKIRSRVGYIPAIENDSTNYMEYYDSYGAQKAQKMQNVILSERQLEFMGEGKRWFDLCRIGKTICTEPYYDEGKTPKIYIPEDYYAYLRSEVNRTVLDREELTEFEGGNLGRVLFPIISSAFTANKLLRGDQNPPYDE